MDFVRGEQMAVLAVAETTIRTMEMPKGLADHDGEPPAHRTIKWEGAPESRKGPAPPALM
jgi:hypothetical protein